MGCRHPKITPYVSDSSQRGQAERNKSESSNKSKEQPSPFVLPNGSIDLSPADNETFSAALCQQRQTAIDNMTYREAINKWRPSSIEELISLIQKLSANGNQIDRAWIIFYWITQNISYDIKGLLSNQIGSQDGNTVFKSKKAVCAGYSSLYADLCNKTGIPCREVSGYSKGFGFDVRQTKFDKTDHAWNIITLGDGHSYFVESTWGSGQLDSSTNEYKKNLDTHYFLCRPEHMIYGHLPEDHTCQLLKNPITLEQYLMLPRTYPSFFTYDLHIVSPVYSNKVDLIEGQSYGQVLIRTSNNDVELSGSLEDEKGNKIKGGDFVYLDKEDQKLWRCQFAPPKPGKYNIFIFASEKSVEGQSSSAATVQFAFDVIHLPLPSISYPLTWSHFFDYDLEIIKPKNSCYIDWPSDTNTLYDEILVRSPDNVYVSASVKDASKGTDVKNGTLTNFNHEKNLWQCLFAPSNTGIPFEITLFAKRSDEDKSDCVAQFDLRPIPVKQLKQFMTFPETYGPFEQIKCQLIEPLNGVLRSGSTVHFRCQIPGAREVAITVDTDSIKGAGLKPDENDMFDSDIQVGQKYVAVWVKLNDGPDYEGFLKYSVH